MAGYIGSKAVNLSTTGADIAGDADVSGALDVGGTFTSQGIDDNATSTAMTLDASGNVGIGTSSPIDYYSDNLVVSAPTENGITIAAQATSNTNYLMFADGTSGDARYRGYIAYLHSTDAFAFGTSGSEAMRIDSSGNLLVGKTSASSGTQGILLEGGTGQVVATATSNFALYANRLSTDGELARFQKDGTTVGSIGVNSGNNLYISSSAGDHAGLEFSFNSVIPQRGGTAADNIVDLGASSFRYDDIYATNGTIQTSDRNEKQDIAELSDAEQRVAVACKGLLRKFRWRDAVEAKGDDARTHFGIIAQDLQAAFAAEGLDAGDYAMFISTTWWETQTEVPAVEAVAEVLDDDGNVVTEAVEAVDAYTRTDTYDTQEEAPEGATERTRLGVRYSELLAFIIGAL